MFNIFKSELKCRHSMSFDPFLRLPLTAMSRCCEISYCSKKDYV